MALWCPTSVPLRLKIPLVFGGVSLLLLGWSLYNETVIEHMGMGWTRARRRGHTRLLEALKAPAFFHWGSGLPIGRRWAWLLAA